jgi:DnaJ-class molecular chaperone
MNHAEKCPVCGGIGKVMSTNYPLPASSAYDTLCHGCGGRGWIIVNDAPNWPTKQVFVQNPDENIKALLPDKVRTEG